ncbi:uncharacterized protein A1O9_09908 [Exophiala aquamarina CBS 119918]|uniref:FAD-dependent oxidoreductase 2 FAD-binding domain-containing protein n=1 Tax=Exophiala aquamarina CBS 119918 TaxID=1182545 RepID=A0A072P4C0_9EURO|nr:uncharacterized protein A1O9_09908 [Exophiala aquamarina CBS 119918]KEF54113.1 hypothetical protein A1O9_09908 [Exophiala aquamarina CBS 119918]
MQPSTNAINLHRLVTRSIRPGLCWRPAVTWRSNCSAALSTSQTTLRTKDFDKVSDVIIVGSGAGGLTAALRAKFRGLEPLIVEKTPKIGGTSVYSGGVLWIPNNHVSTAAGLEDSAEKALTYLEALTPSNTRSSTRERKLAYINEGPKMVKFLEEIGFKWHASRGYSDYHCLEPGSTPFGRGVEGQVFNLKKLGDWRQLMRLPEEPTPAIHTEQVPHLYRMGSSLKDFRKASWFMATTALRFLFGQSPGTFGKSLIGQLLYLNKQQGTEIWRGSGLIELITSGNGTVIGVLVERDGKKVKLGARHGVLLSAGGFGKNSAMREQFQKKGRNTQWSIAAPGDQGDAITAGQKVGAAVDMMDQAWWMPVIMMGETPVFDLSVRSFPHSIIVDGNGMRYVNESQCYNDFGNIMNKHNETTSAVPSWIILDQNHRNKYMLARFPPRQTPKWALENGSVYKDDSIAGLAKQININAGNLEKTISRFNGFAVNGIDEDFKRGLNPYENFYGDPKHGPNPNLGTISKPPFYAVRIYPGDLGTKGGLLTDESARVLKEDGKPILGLYAAGNVTASIMGTRYAGPGATLGPAVLFSYIAMDDIVERLQKGAV